MQKKFVILEDDILLKNLIESQISIIFKEKFQFKFCLFDNLDDLNELSSIDLLIVNFNILKLNQKSFLYLENEKIKKTIILYDDRTERFNFKKFTQFNFLVKPFKLKQLCDIIYDFFIGYETNEKSIEISNDLYFRPETKILINIKKKLIINLTEKESKLLNYILKNKGKVLKKNEILISVWGINEKINTHTLETHIYSLKKKLDNFKLKHSFISSDHLGGYYFKNLK